MLSIANILDSMISPISTSSSKIDNATQDNTDDFPNIIDSFLNKNQDKTSKDSTMNQDLSTYINNIFSDIINLFQAFAGKINSKNTININPSKLSDNLKTSVINIIQDVKSLEKSANPTFDTSILDNIISDIKNPKPNEDIEISISFKEEFVFSKSSFDSVLSSLDRYIFSNKDISSHISFFSFEVFYQHQDAKQNLLSIKTYPKNVDYSLQKNKDSTYINFKNIIYEISTLTNQHNLKDQSAKNVIYSQNQNPYHNVEQPFKNDTTQYENKDRKSVV